MATFHVTSTTSVFTIADNDHAFDNNIGPTDKLIVDDGAFLVATGANAAGALLAFPSVWTATINGSVVSQQFVGLRTNASATITVGVGGDIGGETIGIEASGGATTIKNSGTIAGNDDTGGIGIELAGGGIRKITNLSSGVISGAGAAIDDSFFGDSSLTITNQGLIDGDIQLGLVGTETVNNSGRIAGSVGGSGTIKLTNSGTIEEGISLQEGNDALTNSGTIVGTTGMGGGNDTVNNSGTLETLEMGGGNNTVTNTKDITSFVIFSGVVGTTGSLTNSGTMHGVAFSEGTNQLTNTGTIAFVQLGNGNATFINRGTVTNNVEASDGGIERITNYALIDGPVELRSGNDVLVNPGRITGFVNLGDGEDTMTNFRMVSGMIKNGTVLGEIDLGVGNDTFNGGANAEVVIDNQGADTYNFGGGADTYLAGFGGISTDVLNGGAGTDTYDGTASTPVLINLDTSAHSEAGSSVAANTATGDDVGNDSVMAFENAIGGIGNDIIYGSAVGNLLNGAEGNDFLFGFGGRDMLTGDTGDDTFGYSAINQSGITGTTRDVITDFDDGGDVIDLNLIDADTSTVGDDAFVFLGTNVPFTNTAGELRAYWTGTGQIIEGDVNGDGKADFSIKVTDPNHVIVLDVTDFML